MLENRRLLAAVPGPLAQAAPDEAPAVHSPFKQPAPTAAQAAPATPPPLAPLAPGSAGFPWVFQNPETSRPKTPRGPFLPPVDRTFQSSGSPYQPYMFWSTVYDAVEGDSTHTGRFALGRSQDLAYKAMTVGYSLSGTAEYGTDYTVYGPGVTPSSVFFDVGEISKDIYVKAKEDYLDDPNESVIATLAPSTVYRGGGLSATAYVQSIKWTFSFSSANFAAKPAVKTPIDGTLFRGTTADTSKTVTFSLTATGSANSYGDSVTGAVPGPSKTYVGDFIAGSSTTSRSYAVEAKINGTKLGQTTVTV